MNNINIMQQNVTHWICLLKLSDGKIVLREIPGIEVFDLALASYAFNLAHKENAVIIKLQKV